MTKNQKPECWAYQLTNKLLLLMHVTGNIPKSKNVLSAEKDLG